MIATQNAVQELKRTGLTVEIQRRREVKIRTWLGFRLLRLARWVTGWDLRIVDLHAPTDDINRSARRRAERRNERLKPCR